MLSKARPITDVLSLWQDESGERLTVQARFLLDGSGGPELAFLDSELRLPPASHEDCLLAATAGSGSRGGPGWVAGACLLGLGVATIVVAITVFKARQQSRLGGAGGLREVGRLFRRRRRGASGSNNTGKNQEETLLLFSISFSNFLNFQLAPTLDIPLSKFPVSNTVQFPHFVFY
jgi:hypothetical protein